MLFTACENPKKNQSLNDLNSIKKEFLSAIFKDEIEEGPFHLHYELKTTFFSKDLVSLFGKMNVYDSMPHGWKCYEGKTYLKIKGKFQEINLQDLFSGAKAQEFLRSYCESLLKKDPLTYFAGKDAFKSRLEFNDLKTFVINDQFLMIILQPYVAVSSADSPFVIKIPFSYLKTHCNSKHVLFDSLQKNISSKSFVALTAEESF
jgi:hypothetical protein